MDMVSTELRVFMPGIVVGTEVRDIPSKSTEPSPGHKHPEVSPSDYVSMTTLTDNTELVAT